MTSNPGDTGRKPAFMGINDACDNCAGGDAVACLMHEPGSGHSRAITIQAAA